MSFQFCKLNLTDFLSVLKDMQLHLTWRATGTTCSCFLHCSWNVALRTITAVCYATRNKLSLSHSFQQKIYKRQWCNMSVAAK